MRVWSVHFILRMTIIFKDWENLKECQRFTLYNPKCAFKMEFTLIDRNYVAVLDDIPFYVDMDTLKQGGVYSGSYVLSILHPGMFVPTDIDVYYDSSYRAQEYGYTRRDYSAYFYIRKMYTSSYHGKSLNHIVTWLAREQLMIHLQDYFDLDKCASRIYYNNDTNKVEIAVPVNVDADPLSINMYWKHTSIFDKNDSYERGIKYTSRGFNVEGYDDSGPQCVICHTFNLEILLDTRCCANKYHKSCMEKWNDCDLGEELTENKCKCPICRAFTLNRTIPLLYAIDFGKWAIIKCASCTFLFPHERGSNNCAEAIVGANNNPLICVECSLKFDPNIIIPGQRFKCPQCANVAEFRGGCQQLACCIYGTDKCRDGCDHGGLCGHKWTYKKE